MWLRDFIPLHTNLQKARTMTYDYNSKLFDSKDTSTLSDWAVTLLREVDKLRSPAMVCQHLFTAVNISYLTVLLKRDTPDQLYSLGTRLAVSLLERFEFL